MKTSVSAAWIRNLPSLENDTYQQFRARTNGRSAPLRFRTAATIGKLFCFPRKILRGRAASRCITRRTRTESGLCNPRRATRLSYAKDAFFQGAARDTRVRVITLAGRAFRATSFTAHARARARQTENIANIHAISNRAT